MGKPIVPKWVKRWEAWLALFILLGGAYAGLASTIPDFPRWAWFSEHKALVEVHKSDTILLTGKIKENTIKALEGEVKYLRREGISLRSIQRQIKLKDDYDPKLAEEIEKIEYDLLDVENKLKAKRGY